MYRYQHCGCLCSRIAAIILEWGLSKGYYSKINTSTIKKLFIQGADRDSTLTYPNPDWGYGKLDITKIFEMITTFVATNPKL